MGKDSTRGGFPKPHGDDESSRCFETYKDAEVSSQFLFIVLSIQRTMPENVL
jgi:hypothetical protein